VLFSPFGRSGLSDGRRIAQNSLMVAPRELFWLPLLIGTTAAGLTLFWIARQDGGVVHLRVHCSSNSWMLPPSFRFLVLTDKYDPVSGK